MDHPSNKPLANGRFKPGMFFVTSIILRAKHEPMSKAASKSVLLDRSLNTKKIKLRTLFQRDTNNCKEITISPVRAISGQVAVFLLSGWLQRSRE